MRLGLEAYDRTFVAKLISTEMGWTFALATAPVESFEGWGEDHGDSRVIMGGADKPFSTAHKQEKLISLQNRKLEAVFTRLFPGHTHRCRLEVGRHLR